MSDVLDLKELLMTQTVLQTRMGWPGGRNEIGAKEMLFAANVEIAEVLNEINWKPWKEHPYKEVDKHALTTELTDILQFWANAALCLGLTAEELTEALRRKWEVNHQRIDDGLTTTEDTDSE